MLTHDLHEYDADDGDARVVGGIAVLSLATDKGRVVISMGPEVLERLVLRIQLEFASGGTPFAPAEEDEPVRRRAVG
jgi:hypothetical protein